MILLDTDVVTFLLLGYAKLTGTSIPVSGDGDIRPKANEPRPGQKGRIKSFPESQRCVPVSRVGGSFVKQSSRGEIAGDEKGVAARQER